MTTSRFHCDKCGRFIAWEDPDSTSGLILTPDGYAVQDVSHRCKACSEKHGPSYGDGRSVYDKRKKAEWEQKQRG